MRKKTLNRRELEVLRYMVQGLIDREIADKIYRDVNTVKYRKRCIRDKLGATNNSQAVYIYISRYGMEPLRTEPAYQSPNWRKPEKTFT